MITRFLVRLVLVGCFSLPVMWDGLAAAASTQEFKVQSFLQDGTPYLDGCFQLKGFSNIGCDENRDGIVTFKDVPVGTYTLQYVGDDAYMMAGAGPNTEYTVEVYDTEHNTHPVMLIRAEQATDVSLITRDPKTGKLLTDVCYQLVGFSNIGCDENGDGKVEFKAIPWGNYTIRQTKVPAGYKAMGDYEITLQQVPLPGYGAAHITLIQAENQGGNSNAQYSLVILDKANQSRLAGPENCYQYVDVTKVGCDQGVIDGQIDFVNVPKFDIAKAFPRRESNTCPYVPEVTVNPPSVIQYGPNTFVQITGAERVSGGPACSN